MPTANMGWLNTYTQTTGTPNTPQRVNTPDTDPKFLPPDRADNKKRHSEIPPSANSSSVSQNTASPRSVHLNTGKNSFGSAADYPEVRVQNTEKKRTQSQTFRTLTTPSHQDNHQINRDCTICRTQALRAPMFCLLTLFDTPS